MTVKIYDNNDNELVVTGDYLREEKPVFYYKDGSGDPGCPAEFDIEKVEIGGLDVTNTYSETELDRISDLALEKAIEIENERSDEFEARMMEADID